MNVDETAALVDELAHEECNVFNIASALRKRIPETADEATRATLWALSYRLISSWEEDERATYGPFAPMLELENTVFPPYVGDVSADALAIWDQLSSRLTAPTPRARLHDLLWERRYGSAPHLHARQAIQDYLSAATFPECGGLEVLDLLDRSLELARLLNDRDLARKVIVRIYERIRAELEVVDASSRPGVLIPLIRLLVEVPEPDRPADLADLIGAADALLKENHPFVREGLFQLREMLARSNADELRRLRRAKVEMWFDWGLKHEGLLRVVELGKALELADNTPEATDLRDQIQRSLQETDPATLEMHPISAEVKIPTEQVDALIKAIVREDGIEKALSRFERWGPPSGDPKENVKAVEEQMRSFPVQFLASQVVMNDEGLPVRFLQSDEEKRSAAQIRHEVLGILVHSTFASDALDRIGEKYRPDEKLLADLFHTQLIREEQADAIARAFMRYWENNWDEAIHITLPRNEAVLRRILAEIGGIIYRGPQGHRAGGVRPLGEILQDPRLDLDEGWRRFLWVLLAEPLGLNLRNEYLHGLVPAGTKQHAVLVLKAACYLRLLAFKPTEQA